MSITNEVETTPEERAPGATAAPSAPGAEANPNAPDAFDLLLQVGRALHTYGTPAPELERRLGRLADRLGIRAHVSSTPTALFCALRDRTVFLRLDPGHVNCEKLIALHHTVDRIERGHIGIASAIGVVRAITARRRRYPRPIEVIAAGLTCAGAAALSGARPAEMVTAGVIGAVIGAFAWAVGRATRFAPIFELGAGVIAGVAAIAINQQWVAHGGAPMSVSLVTFAGVILLVPGLTLTLGIAEVAGRHLTSGTSRFVSAAISILLLWAGVALGVHALPGATEAASMGEAAGELSIGRVVITLAAAAITLSVFFCARPRDIPWIFLAMLLGYACAKIVGEATSTPIGLGAGAFAVGLWSHTLGRVRRTPSGVTLLPGVLPLLPSSFGFHCFDALLGGNVEGGIESAFTLMLLAVALVGGLLLASTVLPEARGPRREYLSEDWLGRQPMR